METIIAIMLYLHIVVSPGTYCKMEIDNLKLKNEVEINRIQSDPVKMDQITKEYGDDVTHITIIDDSRTGSIEQRKNINNKIKSNQPEDKSETKLTQPTKEEETVSES